MAGPDAFTQAGAGAVRGPDAEPERIVFVLLPGCSLMALGSALDALHGANEASRAAGGAALYELVLLSANGRAVPTSGGVPVVVQGGLDRVGRPAGLAVFSDTPLPQAGGEAVVEALRGLGTGSCFVAGVGTGAWLLARAGLLHGYRATLHWAYAPLFARQFPDTVVSTHVFEADRLRYTCAGGQAAFDMMLHRIAASHGAEIVQDLLALYSVERPRGLREPQRVPLAARIGGGQPKLTEAVALMEANVGEPLATEDVARLVGVSRRQLERLFKQYLDNLPSRYYLEMRLNRARQLLQQTPQSILQIGLSCGFSSGPHFSNAYRSHFGITPRDQRSPRVAAFVQARAAAPPASEPPDSGLVASPGEPS